MNLDPYFTTYTKVNSKWIIGLQVRAKTIKLLEENIAENLCDLKLDKEFLDMEHKAQYDTKRSN